jgi:hypothetical protein
MEQDKLENLLNKLSEKTREDARPGLATQIKGAIPNNLGEHKSGLNNVRIIIDLRINKLTAAAAIIFTFFLCIVFLNAQNGEGNGVIQDIRGITQYLFQTNKDTQLAEFAKVAGEGRLTEMQIKEIVYYGDFGNSAGADTLLMHWKLDEDKYRVVFSDFRTELVDGPELIKLQANMLKKMAVK